MKRIIVQLTDEQFAALKTILNKEGAPVAWQVRKAVDEYLIRRKKEKNKSGRGWQPWNCPGRRITRAELKHLQRSTTGCYGSTLFDVSELD